MSELLDSFNKCDTMVSKKLSEKMIHHRLMIFYSLKFEMVTFQLYAFVLKNASYIFLTVAS